MILDKLSKAIVVLCCGVLPCPAGSGNRGLLTILCPLPAWSGIKRTPVFNNYIAIHVVGCVHLVFCHMSFELHGDFRQLT